MDGVLVNSEGVWFRLVERAGELFRGRKITRQEFEPTFGQGTQADVEVFGLRCTPAELDAFYVEHFPTLLHEVWVDPDAARVLRELRARKFKLAVVTNTVSPLAEAVLRHARLLELVEGVATPGGAVRAKPAPDLIVEACRRIGVAPADAWMVGDSQYDQLAAQAAKAFFVGFRRAGDAVADSLASVGDLLAAAEPRR